MSESSAPETFQIGSVARLCGMSVHAIRAWEKRYNAVEPLRSEKGRRLYTREAVDRLMLLKKLVDRKHSISTIASLDREALEARWREELDSDHNLVEREHRPIKSFRVLALGTQLHHLLRAGSPELADFQTASREGELDTFSGEMPLPEADLVLINCPTLFRENYEQVLRVIQKANAQRAIVLYNFSQRELLNEIVETSTILPQCNPVTPRELRHILLEELARIPVQPGKAPVGTEYQGMKGIPERRFSNDDLSKIALISGKIDCECPQHLASILFSLTSFETYSDECKSRYPDDARLHGFLSVATSNARAIIEDALDHLLKAEDIRY